MRNVAIFRMNGRLACGYELRKVNDRFGVIGMAARQFNESGTHSDLKGRKRSPWARIAPGDTHTRKMLFLRLKLSSCRARAEMSQAG